MKYCQNGNGNTAVGANDIYCRRSATCEESAVDERLCSHEKGYIIKWKGVIGGAHMYYVSHYESLLGDMLLVADDIGLTGLWFDGQRYTGLSLSDDYAECETPVIVKAKRWLDVYFSGHEPELSIPLHLTGTEFQEKVWEILCTIPYGQTVTYGEIAKKMAVQRGLKRMSAQAVGNAVGRNPVAIIVPCHRVIGADGSLTGYGGGLDRKIALLKLEQG